METIDLHVDARGLFGPGGLFLARAEIVEAYLREPITGATLGAAGRLRADRDDNRRRVERASRP
jgi:hypothetical protein